MFLERRKLLNCMWIHNKVYSIIISQEELFIDPIKYLLFLKTFCNHENNHPGAIVDVIRHEKAISKNNVIE